MHSFEVAAMWQSAVGAVVAVAIIWVIRVSFRAGVAEAVKEIRGSAAQTADSAGRDTSAASLSGISSAVGLIEHRQTEVLSRLGANGEHLERVDRRLASIEQGQADLRRGQDDLRRGQDDTRQRIDALPYEHSECETPKAPSKPRRRRAEGEQA